MDKKEDTIVKFRVKEALKGKKYDIDKLKDFFDVDRRQTVTDIVNGKREPSLKRVGQLAEFFDMEVHEFIELSDSYYHIYNESGQWKGILPKCRDSE